MPAFDRKPRTVCPRVWPLAIAGVLAAACLMCCWLLFSHYQELRASAHAAGSRQAALVAERDQLLQLLALEPCEAKRQSESIPPEQIKPVTGGK